MTIAKSGWLAASAATLCSSLLSAADVKPSFSEEIIDDAISIGYGLVICDIDGDGKQDILLADKREIAWYQNPEWTKRVIARNLTLRDNVCLAARDLDGDGKVEIAVGANWNPGETSDAGKSGSLHYLIRPEDPGKRWESVRLPNEPTVHRMHWVRDSEGRYQLVVLPLHGRGNRGGDGENRVKVLAYSMPADPRSVADWKTTLVDESLHMTHNFDLRESASGAEWMLIGGKEGAVAGTIPGSDEKPNTRWIVETGKEAGKDCQGFGEIRFAPSAKPGAGPPSLGGNMIFAGIEPMHGNQVVTYGNGTPARLPLETGLAQGHALAWGDLLGNGAVQIVAGWRNPNAGKKVGIRLYFGLSGNAPPRVYTVSDNTMACEDLKIADLNGDGKSDIIACGRATKNVAIYWNRTQS